MTSGNWPERIDAAVVTAPDRDASVTLFAAGGPFARHPGPALAVAEDGDVIASNAAGERMVQMLHERLPGEVAAAVNAALDGCVAQINPFVVPGEPGCGGEKAYDLLVLPWPAAQVALLLARDITVERSLRTALIDSRQRFKDLVEISNDVAWETDRHGQFAFISADSLLGFLAADLIGRPAAELLLAPDVELDNPFAAPLPIADVQVWCKDADGEASCLAVTAAPLRDAAGDWSGARGVCRDVTAQRARAAEQAAARERERLLAFVLRSIRGQVAPVDAIESILQILVRGFGLQGAGLLSRESGGGFSEIARIGARPVLGDFLQRLGEIGPDESWISRIGADSGECMAFPTCHLDRRNGALLLYGEAAAQPLSQPEQALISEISLHLGSLIAQVASHDQLHKLSTTDPLTGLLNRRAFLAGLEEAQVRALDDPRTAVLFFIDLDNFKLANDLYGHQQGDAILVELAQILVHHVRGVDLVGRLGGDEFGILITGIDRDQAEQRAASIARSFHEIGADLEGPDVGLGLSIGMAWLDNDPPGGPEEWIRRADAKMYEAKRKRRSRGREPVPSPDLEAAAS